MICCHRINSIKLLNETPIEYGIEIDLRDSTNGDGKIHISHDPFTMGENFEDFLKHYRHSFIILNIKSERIEWKVLDLLKTHNIIDNYFFLDSSFPMIYQLSNANETNIAIRFSEYESIDTAIKMKDKIKWVWVDCFTNNPLNVENYVLLKNLGLKICFVSPELQQQPEKIDEYKMFFKDNKIHLDMICTKIYNIEKWK